ncbi:MAG: hypothetical protein H6Q78_361 [Candidatus Krumholzibacteriota bacterium]|nr:hypothetical protein [Candidatus Krumholzibacteriota bacterium]
MRTSASILERISIVLGRRGVLLPALVYLLALWGFLGSSYARFGFPLDDAWIHRVYSRSVAFGHGFAYNDGEQEAGSTSPLWAIVTAPAHWLEGAGDGTVPAAVKLIGVLLGLATLAAVIRIGARLGGSALAGFFAAAIFALEPRFLFSSLAGMENILLVALWVWGCDALLGRRHLSALVFFALMPITRPEAVVLLPLCIPALVALTRRRAWGRATIAAWVIPLVPVVLWSLFCKATTGHFLPNTFYVKAQPFALDLDRIGTAWRSIFLNGLVPWTAWIAGLVAFLAVCLAAGRNRGVWRFLLLTIPPLVYLAAVAGSRTIVFDGYYWTRWLDPAAIVLMIPFSIGIGAFIARWMSTGVPDTGDAAPVPIGRYRAIAGVAAVAVLVTSVPSYRQSYIDRRDHLASDSRAIDVLNVQTGTWIAENTPLSSIVAVNDAGAIRYFGRRRTIDLEGLNHARIAFRETTKEQAIAGADWLAIFPGWYQGTPAMTAIAAAFEPRKDFRIAFEEYTICRDPSQTVVVVFERRRPGQE